MNARVALVEPYSSSDGSPSIANRRCPRRTISPTDGTLVNAELVPYTAACAVALAAAASSVASVCSADDTDT